MNTDANNYTDMSNYCEHSTGVIKGFVYVGTNKPVVLKKLDGKSYAIENVENFGSFSLAGTVYPPYNAYDSPHGNMEGVT